jgi:rhodanese-related sulfurtransferase/DNA-binding transcriptional ArsR family regulator
MSMASAKHLLLEHLAELTKALANPNRLELIELLAQGAQPVEGLAQRTGLSFANVSQHLQTLKKAGLVIGERDGKNIRYRLQDGPIVEAISGLRRLAAHSVAAIGDVRRRYLDDMDGMDAVSHDELMVRMQSDSVVLLDVRPGDEFASGHLPGAMHIDVTDLEARAAQLPKDREIVAYCRGPYCVMSYKAVQVLRGRGYTVRRLEDGFPEWKAAGLPVERA